MFLKNIFPLIKSFQATAHYDEFHPFKIFFASMSKFTAPYWNHNTDFNAFYSTFLSQCITGRNTHIIINIHYPAPCTKISTEQLVLGDKTLGYLEETDLDSMFETVIIFLRQHSLKMTQHWMNWTQIQFLEVAGISIFTTM
jgi:hypothetical protein